MYCCLLTIFLRNTTEIFLSSKFDIEGVADITAARWYPFLSDGIQFLPRTVWRRWWGTFKIHSRTSLWPPPQEWSYVTGKWSQGIPPNLISTASFEKTLRSSKPAKIVLAWVLAKTDWEKRSFKLIIRSTLIFHWFWGKESDDWELIYKKIDFLALFSDSLPWK